MTQSITAEQLSYAVHGKTLLHSIDLTASSGQFIAIVGPNGAGKTTLMRSLVGLLQVQGYVRIGTELVKQMPKRERAKRLAFISASDEHGVDELSVREVVAHGRFAHRRGFFDHAETHQAIVAQALEQTDLTAFADQHFADLSSGERRRVWIALGLAQEADILVLDEPTAHLDIRHVQRILTLLRNFADCGHTVITVLHDLNEAAQYADFVALLDHGQLVAFDTPHNVLTTERITSSYGVNVEIMTASDGKPRVFPLPLSP